MYALFVLLKSDTVPKGCWGSEHHIVLHCACKSTSTYRHGRPLELGWIEGTEGADFSRWIHGARADSRSASNCFYPAPASGLSGETTGTFTPSTEIPPTVWLTFGSRR